MKTVILFGGGDGGGLLITGKGVRPIPPFDPAIRLNLKSAAAMVNAVTAAPNESTRNKIAKLAMSLCNLAVEQVEGVVGALDADRSLIFQDEDGGFTCGSTGKPPIPLPWPPPSQPTVQDLIAEGFAEADLALFLEKARSKGIPISDIFEKPAEVAKKLGLKLSEKSANDLQLVAPSNLEKIDDTTSREIVRFFHKVAEDGRYLETWHSRPYEVSRALKFEISEAALERLVTRSWLTQEPQTRLNPLVAIAICIVIIVETSCPPRRRVIDRSGIEKI